ncbi:hypothetical protein LQK30_004263 [Vibrio vulnificus]|nr:hypothetical protein [Vibrio vulnificus]ELH9435032.1 hypothetical protein [Vibrio vulnificus]
MKIEHGSESTQQFVQVMYHEFTLCEKAFESFFLLAESNILGKDGYETRESLYKNYAAFLTHLYEFYVACFKRQQGTTDNIHYSKLDNLFTSEVRKLMRNMCNQIESGRAPSWVNDISYYQEAVPDDFGQKFRDVRNNSAHVDIRRVSGGNRPTLKEFIDNYHKFVLFLYDSARDLWGSKREAPYEISHIREFNLSQNRR